MSEEILRQIKSRGYWFIRFRPNRFVPDKIASLKEVTEIVNRRQVRFRGWYFPHIKPENPKYGIDYIEVSTSFMSSIEVWRMYQSVQFVSYNALGEDWLELNPLARQMVPPGTSLDMISTLYTLTEIYEFISRLASDNLLGESIEVEINLHNVKDRKLVAPGRYIHDHVCKIQDLPYQKSVASSEIIAGALDFSLDHFVWLVERFGFVDAPRDVFRRDQERFLQGKY